MLRAPRPLRCFRLLLAVLQLSLGVGAVVADAIQEAESARARPHVEARGDPSCPAPHPADCSICQFLQSPAAASSGGADPLPPTCEGSLALHASGTWRAAWTPPSPLARGPPALS